MTEKTLPLPDGTDAVHAGVPRARADRSLSPAIVQTATYTFADTDDLERFQSGEDPDPDRQRVMRKGPRDLTLKHARKLAAEVSAMLVAGGIHERIQ